MDQKKFVLINYNTNKCVTLTGDELSILELAVSTLYQAEEDADHKENAKKCDQVWAKLNKVDQEVSEG